MDSSNTTLIIVAIIGLLGSLIVAGIGLYGTLISSLIAAYIAAKKQVSKDINKLSDNLPSWKLLYEHDEKGNQIDGSLIELIDAIGKACPIKVKIFSKNNKFEMMKAQWVIVENNLVHASNTEQISIQKDESTKEYGFQDDAYHYYVIVNSKGNHTASRYYVDGRKGKTNSVNKHLAWFGLIPPK